MLRPSLTTARRALFLALLAPVAASPTVEAQAPTFALEVEGGPVWQSYNDVEIPNDGSATRFSLSDLVGSGPEWTGRVYLSWWLTERSSIRLLYAPFTLVGTVPPGRASSFAGAPTDAGTRR
ncbi:MAG: hypothetical protein R3253_04245 [Longimicrobiales bacterium]|nr:hypothetical protein [Longimicrobiales bacterium]